MLTLASEGSGSTSSIAIFAARLQGISSRRLVLVRFDRKSISGGFRPEDLKSANIFHELALRSELRQPRQATY